MVLRLLLVLRGSTLLLLHLLLGLLLLLLLLLGLLGLLRRLLQLEVGFDVGDERVVVRVGQTVLLAERVGHSRRRVALSTAQTIRKR